MIGGVGGGGVVGGGFSIQGAPTFAQPTEQKSGRGLDVSRSTFEPAQGIAPGGCFPTPKPPVTPPGGGQDQTQNLVMQLLQVVMQLLSMIFGQLGQGGGRPGGDCGPGLPPGGPVGNPVPVYGPGMNLAEANAPIFMPYMSKELQDLIGLQNSI